MKEAKDPRFQNAFTGMVGKSGFASGFNGSDSALIAITLIRVHSRNSRPTLFPSLARGLANAISVNETLPLMKQNGRREFRHGV